MYSLWYFRLSTEGWLKGEAFIFLLSIWQEKSLTAPSRFPITYSMNMGRIWIYEFNCLLMLSCFFCTMYESQSSIVISITGKWNLFSPLGLLTHNRIIVDVHDGNKCGMMKYDRMWSRPSCESIIFFSIFCKRWESWMTLRHGTELG